MAVKLAPQARLQYVDASGNPYSGAKLFFYAAGTTTKQNTYTTSVGDVANTNPVVLDSSGRTPYGVWLTAGANYKIVLAPANDTDPPTSPIFTEDVISGINDDATGLTQWAASGSVPTYVSATQFTVPGDETSTFLVNRRIKVSVTAGTLYGYISVSAYTSLTTVTVVMDSGTLDSGLTSVDVGILTDLSGAIPPTITRNTTAQTLTNKSLSDSTTYIIDEADATKKVQFQVSGVTTGTTRVLTVPDHDGTIATLAGTQALTNKTYNGNTWTAGTGIFTMGAGKTLTVSNTITFTATDGSTLAIGTGGTLTSAAFLAPGTSGNVMTSNGSAWVSSAPAASTLDERAISSTDTVGTADIGQLVRVTSGTFTLAFAPVATLGDKATGWICNDGTGDVTLNPNGTEQIDGLTTRMMFPGERIRWYVEGSAIKSLVEKPYVKTYTTSGTHVEPSGYKGTGRKLTGGGGGGGGGRRAAAGQNRDGGGGGGGGAVVEDIIFGLTAGTSYTVTIGAAGTAGAAAAGDNSDGGNGGAGGNSSFGSGTNIVTAYGGGGGRGGSTNGVSGGGGGGSGSAGATGSTTSVVGGNPSVVSGVNSVGGGGGGGQLNVGGNAEYGGGGGGGADSDSGGVAFKGGSSIFGGGGGGGGATINTADAIGAGEEGGVSGSYTVGGNAGAGTAGSNGRPGNGGAGGATAGSTGNAGGAPGGGGGGGGAQANGSASGAGGAGGRGEVTVFGVL